MRTLQAWSMAVVGLTTLSALAQTATIELDHTAYLPGEAIVADFAGGPGNRKDWIGVYPEGVIPGSQGSTIWRYVDGTTAGNTGLADGSVTFPTGLRFSGSWTAFLLVNDGYEVSTQVTFTVVDSTSKNERSEKKT